MAFTLSLTLDQLEILAIALQRSLVRQRERAAANPASVFVQAVTEIEALQEIVRHAMNAAYFAHRQRHNLD